LEIVPIRRRGESHLLAAISAAALVAIAIAVVKPWGQDAPGRPVSASPSPQVEIARASTTIVAPSVSAVLFPIPSDQSGMGDAWNTDVTYTIVIEPGANSDGHFVVCTYDPSATSSIGSRASLAADPSAIEFSYSGPNSAAVGGTGVPICVATEQQGNGPALPGLSAT
jgi:hypothetical protein